MTFAAIGKKSFLQGMAIFIIGGIFGASLALARIGKTWDQVTLDNASLIDEVERLAGELASRERALTAERGIPVRSIDVEVEGSVSEQQRLQVEGEAREILKPLLGQDVDSLNPTLIEKALHRSFLIGKQQLLITPTRLLLGTKMIVHLQVTEIRGDVSP